MHDEYVIETRSEPNNDQVVYQFPNGYGASIVRHQHSYGGPSGLWEGAVLHNDQLCYDTPVTDDVVGWMNTQEVSEFLASILALPEKTVDA